MTAMPTLREKVKLKEYMSHFSNLRIKIKIGHRFQRLLLLKIFFFFFPNLFHAHFRNPFWAPKFSGPTPWLFHSWHLIRSISRTLILVPLAYHFVPWQQNEARTASAKFKFLTNCAGLFNHIHNATARKF